MSSTATAETKRSPLRIAILGTRGIPANYGGFESFAEELSTRLALRGHEVTVYGRSHFVDPNLRVYRGVNIRVLPCVRHKYFETVSHTLIAAAVAAFSDYDVTLICNAANAFVCPLPRLRGQEVILNVDGMERLRKKWNWLGKAFYRLSEFLATQLPDHVVTDARTIQEYYLREYGYPSRFIPYGAPVERLETWEMLRELNLRPEEYLLYVSRLEPENNAHLVIGAYLASRLLIPLVIVGDAPYSRRYIERLKHMAKGGNILLPGAIYGRGYRELLSHALCYVHATEVGGTHPALIEAMGAGCIVLVNDTPENREVVDGTGLFYRFNDVESLSRLMAEVCTRRPDYEKFRRLAQDRVRQAYDWDQVVDRYEGFFYELVDD